MLWTLYGFGASVNVLSFTVLNDGFAKELAGRANTAVNLLMFTRQLRVQWGIGLVVDGARAALGLDAAGGLRARVCAVAGAERRDARVVRRGLAPRAGASRSPQG